MSDKEPDKSFVYDLIQFYKDFIAGNSNAIKTLATIQESHPDQYELLLQLKDDPSIIGESKLLNENEKTLMLIIILRASKLARKSQNLFELSVKDKRQLAEDLETFAKFVEEKMKELMKQKEEEQKVKERQAQEQQVQQQAGK